MLPQPNPTPGSILPGSAVGDFVYFDDFVHFGYNQGASSGMVSATANDCAWLLTIDDSTTTSEEVIAVSDDEPGGVLTITTTAGDNEYISMQLNGEAWKVAANKDIYFECRFKVTDVSECDWFLGLATTDVTGSSPILAGAIESIGFRCPDSTGDIDYVVEDATVETTGDTGVDLADGTFVTVAFWVHGNRSVDFMVGGQTKATVKTNIPDGDAVTLTMEIRNDGAAANTLEVDYIYCSQQR